MLFEYCLVVLDVDAWNAGLSNQFIEDAFWFVLGISILDVESQFLFIEFLAAACKNYLDGYTAFRWY